MDRCYIKGIFASFGAANILLFFILPCISASFFHFQNKKLNLHGRVAKIMYFRTKLNDVWQQ